MYHLNLRQRCASSSSLRAILAIVRTYPSSNGLVVALSFPTRPTCTDSLVDRCASHMNYVQKNCLVSGSNLAFRSTTKKIEVAISIAITTHRGFSTVGPRCELANSSVGSGILYGEVRYSWQRCWKVQSGAVPTGIDSFYSILRFSLLHSFEARVGVCREFNALDSVSTQDSLPVRTCSNCRSQGEAQICFKMSFAHAPVSKGWLGQRDRGTLD